MPDLNLKRNLADPDRFYANLMAIHDGLSKAESDALNARLILIMANHIGDESVLEQALSAAAEVLRKPEI
ncbi:DUF2783 domain-containing protein [Roseinatronobacter bogoriensis]|uniref:DUF2783 domain-containing protein n=1 Tax=Roseinatronobacter bogoriensis subsp. barguzinensis TaxID=441209 RepID=A0A2K8K5Z2_9RHOB|nr:MULTISPECIES: DUF2783 domain-containing protein [Rhodobaca]ATX64867.1 DUF2783 domain-containing protein [Rhodobaca barguzinensis]MBB4208667.1 hypothetical protein [Rhodobaca bogoriensis DSM 18756]TDW38065.1 uncharacterized protein DUF2783 [Rhodobaca barguzinensis]TDY69765.1 uncharacterized protein DUF2783 [Rhodobaca bogoriensis DSM 18756]